MWWEKVEKNLWRLDFKQVRGQHGGAEAFRRRPAPWRWDRRHSQEVCASSIYIFLCWSVHAFSLKSSLIYFIQNTPAVLTNKRNSCQRRWMRWSEMLLMLKHEGAQKLHHVHWVYKSICIFLNWHLSRLFKIIWNNMKFNSQSSHKKKHN